MTRRLDSIQRSGYLEPFEPDEDNLARVVEKLPLARPEDEDLARGALLYILEEFHTQRLNIEYAKPVKKDLRDLKKLLKLVKKVKNGEPFDKAWRAANEFAQSLSSTNEVLHRRLRWAFRPKGLRFPLPPDQLSDHEEIIAGLVDTIAGEDGRGRPTDRPAIWLANRLYDFWKQFTDLGTTTDSRDLLVMGPFPSFVQTAGKLVDKHFRALHPVRVVNEHHAAKRRSRTS